MSWDDREPERPDPRTQWVRRRLIARALGLAVGVFLFVFVGLLFNYPLTWAVLSLTAIGIIAGFFTTHFVLGIRQGWRWWALVPVTGAGWLLFFWGLFTVFAMTRRAG